MRAESSESENDLEPSPQQLRPGNAPSAAYPSPTLLAPGSEEFSTNSATDAALQPQKRAKKIDYPWLVVMAEPCHSDRQIASGKDLSDQKKKYKKMFCIYCAEFNPRTPWAHLKARKYESDSFIDHERSSHHLKAVTARSALSSRSLCTLPVVNSVQGDVFPSSFSQSGPSLSALPSPLLLNGAQSWESLSMSSPSEPLLPPRGLLIPSLTDAQKSHLPFPDAPSELPPDNLPTKQHFLDSVYDVALRPRAKFAPEWLRVQGKLTFSDRQIASGKDLRHVKKKYKMMMCAFCAEYNTSGLWATMKLRKFETAVLSEHEQSLNHRKAREQREKTGRAQSMSLSAHISVEDVDANPG